MIQKDILREINAYEKIIILRHIIPDGDAYGSQLGLKYLILANFNNKNVKVGGANSKYLEFIGKMDQICDDDYNDALVIITDCANFERIDDQRFKNAKSIIKIDHHLNGNDYANLNWVDSSYVAACEMIAQLALDNNLNIPSEAARVLYHGIVTDSGRFLYNNVSSRTFNIASKLLLIKFDLQELYQRMYIKKLENLDFISYVYQNYQKYEQTIIFKLNYATIKNKDWNFEMVSSQVNLLSNIENYPIWAFFVEDSKGDIRVELRSNKYFINDIAAKYNGGGHKFAAGTKLKTWDNVIKIINDLEKLK